MQNKTLQALSAQFHIFLFYNSAYCIILSHFNSAKVVYAAVVCSWLDAGYILKFSGNNDEMPKRLTAMTTKWPQICPKIIKIEGLFVTCESLCLVFSQRPGQASLTNLLSKYSSHNINFWIGLWFQYYLFNNKMILIGRLASFLIRSKTTNWVHAKQAKFVKQSTSHWPWDILAMILLIFKI